MLSTPIMAAPLTPHLSGRVIGGTVHCYCGDPAAHLMSRTPQNPNRYFYKCPRNDTIRCRFWQWEDQITELTASPASRATLPDSFPFTFAPASQNNAGRTFLNTPPNSQVSVEENAMRHTRIQAGPDEATASTLSSNSIRITSVPHNPTKLENGSSGDSTKQKVGSASEQTGKNVDRPSGTSRLAVAREAPDSPSPARTSGPSSLLSRNDASDDAEAAAGASNSIQRPSSPASEHPTFPRLPGSFESHDGSRPTTPVANHNNRLSHSEPDPNRGSLDKSNSSNSGEGSKLPDRAASGTQSSSSISDGVLAVVSKLVDFGRDVNQIEKKLSASEQNVAALFSQIEKLEDRIKSLEIENETLRKMDQLRKEVQA